MSRRRSTTQTLTLGLTAFLDHVNAHPEQHRALQILSLNEPAITLPGVPQRLTEAGVEADDGSGDARLADAASRYAQQWLTEVSRTQRITWNTPVPLLAQFVVTTLDGLITALLDTQDATAVNKTAALFAYHLAQHGTRTTHHRASGTP